MRGEGQGGYNYSRGVGGGGGMCIEQGFDDQKQTHSFVLFVLGIRLCFIDCFWFS